MKSPVIAYVGWLLILSAFGFYGYGIVQAIWLSWSANDIDYAKFPETLSATVSTIQALLLTNLGVLLGISVAKPGSAVARHLMLNSTSNNTIAPAIADPLDLREKIQLSALIIYILSLIACLIAWGHNKFSSETKDIVAVVSESGKMFIGVVLAYLTSVLGRR